MQNEQTIQPKISVGISNKHVHISKEDLEILFGEGYELTKKVDLVQPGQFASNETITIRGPKGEFENVRILGPVRKESQVEISLTDSFRLGVKAPIKESGDLEVTPGLELVGPNGTVNLEKGTIVALRHIHMSPKQAEVFGVKDKEIVEVETFGERKVILGNVLVRVSEQFELEMHLDTDEANACALKNKDYVVLRKSNN
ncbi:MAG: phosphate propanoyltransferase [bacterium]|nr:phosphate propanoyltransferase [bacterium]